MSDNLVIVESPAKSKTIEKYLGNDFKVISTVGHLRNLPSKKGIDVENDYKMNYELIDRDHNKPEHIIRDIKKALKNAKKLYLADFRSCNSFRFFELISPSPISSVKIFFTVFLANLDISLSRLRTPASLV